MIGDVVHGSTITLRSGLNCVDMPTAIFRTYTKGGFVVAADSRRELSASGRVFDDTQKIYLINTPQAALAYSFAGTIGVTPNDSDDVIFSIYRASRSALSQVTNNAPKDFGDYVHLFAQEVYNEFYDVLKKNPEVRFGEERYQDRSPDPGFTIVNIWFDGYYRGSAATATVEFFHINQKLEAKSWTPRPRIDDPPVCYGSSLVLKRMRKGDSVFAEYGLNLSDRNWGDLTLSDAVDLSVKVIEAQMSEAARQIDPTFWQSIGGPIHVATVAKTDGAVWVSGREPKALLDP